MDIGELKIAIEDKFIILQLNVEGNLLPQGSTLSNVAYILESFSNDYTIFCDFRKVKQITNDVVEFVNDFKFKKTKLLVNAEELEFFKKNVRTHLGIFPVKNFNTQFNETPLDLTLFTDDNTRDLDYSHYRKVLENAEKLYKGVPTKSEYELFIKHSAGKGINERPYFYSFEEYSRFCEMSASGLHLGGDLILSRRYLNDFITQNGRNSLFTEFSISNNKKGEIVIHPYQSNAIYNVEGNNNILQSKPYIRAQKASNLIDRELLDFQLLLNNQKVKESDIQKFLEKHPHFLQALGYRKIHPHVVLERDDGSKLIPDFMLEPVKNDWWDILDIKLPTSKTEIYSKPDRYRFSSNVSELHAQLREYSAYFENEKYAKRIEEKYGIKCYKPRLIGVIGKDNDSPEDARQQRRLETSYSDLEILTFDRLYNIAKSRPLI